ncbi:uncharacterized protein [Epargyreus clarus]|uniref:uncharacterized protein n=1 Tax=Epargyreus clarus TaxID=520877 RepID=UPI003C2EEB9A
MTTLWERIQGMKEKLLVNSCTDLINLINILPRIGGYTYQRKKVVVSFWIVHMALLFYWYLYTTVVYQMNYAGTFVDNVNSFLNISLFILIMNGSVWILRKRADIKIIIELIQKNDDLVTETSKFQDKKRKMLRQIQIVVIFYYIFQFVNDICIYIPSKVLSLADYTVGSCIGLEPVNKPPNRAACALIVAFQELTSIVAIVGYDVTLIFILAHTTAMYNLLFEDLMSLDDVKTCNNSDEVSKRLRNYIARHGFLLQTVRKIQEMYSSPIGVGFGVNAMLLSLCSFLPRELWMDFTPIVYYTLCVFFLYCLQGQRLTTASEKLERAVYCCGWEKFNSENQTLVLLMLKQSQRPVILLAADIVPIRIYTFAKTLQAIYRFFAVFKL